MDGRARATHAVLVAAPGHLGSYRDAVGHVRERGCAPAPCARGAGLLRAAGGRNAQLAQGGSTQAQWGDV